MRVMSFAVTGFDLVTGCDLENAIRLIIGNF